MYEDGSAEGRLVVAPSQDLVTGDDIKDDDEELVLSGFDLKAVMGLEDPVEMKRQILWLHNLVRQAFVTVGSGNLSALYCTLGLSQNDRNMALP